MIHNLCSKGAAHNFVEGQLYTYCDKCGLLKMEATPKKRKPKSKGTQLSQKVASIYGTKCYYCSCVLTLDRVVDGGPRALTLDHYVPLSRGGSWALDNLRPACGPCNARKANMLPEEFLKILREPLDGTGGTD